MNHLIKNIQTVGKVLSIILLVFLIICLAATGYDIYSLMNGTTGEEIANIWGEIFGNLVIAGMLFLAWFSQKHTVYLMIISLLMLTYTIIVSPVEMLLTEILAVFRLMRRCNMAIILRLDLALLYYSKAGDYWNTYLYSLQAHSSKK